MPIPESQLRTWSHQGSVPESSATYNTIKNVLEAANTPYSGKDYSVFLQGSYGNDTNIYAESDVDIVVKLDDCWSRDIEALPEDEKEAYRGAFVNATYTHVDFKRDVLKVLTHRYGSDVKAGDKAIAIAAGGNRRAADVIAASQFRRYYKFRGVYDQSYDEGICFYNSAGERIANYPKQHAANLTSKNQNTNKWFKPMVRVLKNLRGRLVEKNVIKAGVAPSYYVEGLLYNVPNEKFGGSFQDCFVNAMNWVQNEADMSKLVCANEQYYLLRDNFHTCWPKANCDIFVRAAVDLWNRW
jgi:hypothetical protein